MIRKPFVVTGLDIGSSKIAAVVARLEKNGRFEIMAHATGEAGGIAKGMLVDLKDSIGSVSKVLTKLKKKASKKLGKIYVNISGEDVKGAKALGMIPISLRGREIMPADIEKSVNAASTIHLPFDREILHKIVHSFSIDDQPWIKNPLGLYASRLACEAYVITANINHIQSIYKCVNDSGYDVKEIAFTGIADASSLLDKLEKESGAILIDMGNSLTEVSVYLNGSLDGFDIVSIGSLDAEDDFRSNAVFNELISRIMARLKDLSKRSVEPRAITPERVTGSRVKAPSIILTGGFALADGMIEFMEEKLSHPVRMGAMKGVQGDISGLDSVRLATAIGLARYACEKQLSEEHGISRSFSSKVVELFNNYF